jgi:hypothetical protein
MNYLDLCNKVLQRLRENTITVAQLNSDPFFRVIGAAVNDAKNAVEDAWQWSQLRQDDVVNIVLDQQVVTLPNSADVNYIIHTILNADEGNYMRWNTTAWMKTRYRNQKTEVVNPDVPAWFAFAPDDINTGNKQITIYPPSNDSYELNIDRVKHQEDLVAWDDRLLVPSLPVYTLATALASRERGEVGGAPTSALFEVADKHLSDAIAYDSARFPEEMDWFGGNDNPMQTNVRNY